MQVTHQLNLDAATEVMLTALGPNLRISRQLRRGGLYGTTGSEMPRQSLAQAFGLWRSGKFTNGTPGTAFAGRIS